MISEKDSSDLKFKDLKMKRLCFFALKEKREKDTKFELNWKR